MIVYSNGCSFSLNQPQAYSDYVAQSLNAELINKGQLGACYRSIIRTTVRDLLEINQDNILVLLGLTMLGRTELWRNNQPVTNDDGHFTNILPNRSDIDFRRSSR